MKEKKQKQTPIKDQAAEWALKIDTGLSQRQEDELCDWLESHEDAPDLLAKSQETWKSFEILDPRHFELADLSDSNSEHAQPKLLSRKLWAFLAGAAAIIAISGGIFHHVNTDTDVRAPSVRSFSYADADFYELEDGSTVDLNDGAEVTCKYTENRREFWIKSGEAYFTVAKDPDRPFDVYAGETKLRAIGTEFNVKYDGPSVEVLVTEGIVSLSVIEKKPNSGSNHSPHTATIPKNLIQNQKAVVHRSDSVQNGYIIEEVDLEEVSQILLWKPVTFTFDSTPLSDVVKSFNKHNEEQLVILDPKIESLKIVATFRSNKLDGFINLLQATSNINAEKKGDQILLSSKN